MIDSIGVVSADGLTDQAKGDKLKSDLSRSPKDDEANVSRDVLQNEPDVSLLKIFHAAQDSDCDQPLGLQKFWESNTREVILKCG